MLTNEVNLFVDERKLLAVKLSESASEIASWKEMCEMQCDYCGQNVENLTKLQEHTQNHHMKDRETQYCSFTTSPIQQFIQMFLLC